MPDLVGRVRLVSPQIDRATQLGHVRISLTNNPSLKVGMFARANIDAKRSCGVAVPRTAIDHLTVQVVKGNTIETRKVKVGLSSDTSTEILEGLDVGEIVVADAGTSLHDGDQVKTMFAEELDRSAGALMALNISAWSIRNPLPSIVFSIILLVLGWVSFTKLAVTRLPSADIPVISVAVSQFGAAPAELESQVTKTIEDGVSGVEGVRHISSSITDGLSVTTIQFALETNTDRALNDVKDAVTRVRANLPQNVNEPLIQRVDVIGLPIVTYAAISPGKTPEQLSYFVDDVVKRALQGVRNVAQVERIGGVEREILVSLDPDRLQAAGLTAVNVSQILRGTNVDLAGGRAEIGKNDQAIRTLAGAKTLNELAGTMIPLFGGGEVRLDDLGTVTDTIADRRTFARFNGEPVVALGIKRSKGASDVVVAAAVQKRIDALKVGLSRRRSEDDRHLGRVHQGQLRGGDLDAVRRRDPRRHRRLAVPARHPRHHHRRDLAAAVDLPGVLGDGHARLLAQPGLASSPSRCRRVFWSTTPSSRSRTSCATCGWASRPTARRSRPPTKSASPSSRSR